MTRSLWSSTLQTNGNGSSCKGLGRLHLNWCLVNGHWIYTVVSGSRMLLKRFEWLDPSCIGSLINNDCSLYCGCSTFILFLIEPPQCLCRAIFWVWSNINGHVIQSRDRSDDWDIKAECYRDLTHVDPPKQRLEAIAKLWRGCITEYNILNRNAGRVMPGAWLA